MFVDDNPTPSGAASQNEAPGDATIAGAAPQLDAAIRAELAKIIPPATEIQVVRLEPEVRDFIRAVVLEVAGKTDTPPAPGGDIVTVTPEVQDSVKTLVDLHVSEARAEILAECKAIANQNATDVTEGVKMLLKPFEPFLTRAKELLGFAKPAAAESPAGPREIVAGDKVKVWIDPAKKTFQTGTVREVHEAGHSFDVELSTGALAHVQAAGLELDELA